MFNIHGCFDKVYGNFWYTNMQHLVGMKTTVDLRERDTLSFSLPSPTRDWMREISYGYVWQFAVNSSSMQRAYTTEIWASTSFEISLCWAREREMLTGWFFGKCWCAAAAPIPIAVNGYMMPSSARCFNACINFKIMLGIRLVWGQRAGGGYGSIICYGVLHFSTKLKCLTWYFP